MKFVSVSEAAQKIGRSARPKDITDIFYRRQLDVERCPIVGWRRLIPVDYLGEVEAKLLDLGYLETARERPAKKRVKSG